MTAPRLVLIVGSPRSGTTWLQSLLGAHPAVATPQETDLFRLYLQPLADAWDKQVADLRDTTGHRRRKGLPTVLDRDQFDALGRQFVATMIDSVARQKTTATVVLEKSPANGLCTDVIQRFWPEAGFIHVVRDGRDVAASLMAASQSFGRDFAPPDLTRAARMWKQRVIRAREAVDAPGGYAEIRYEALHTDGVAALQRAHAVCGVEVSEDDCTRALERFSFDGMASSGAVADSIITGGEFSSDDRTRVEPEGFFRKGVVGGWRDGWQFEQRNAFDAAAGDLLVELGYEPDRSWVGSGRARAHRTRRLVHSGAHKLRNLAARLEAMSADSLR